MNDLTLPRAHTKLDDLVLLTKVRVNALVVATTAGGYYMAAPGAIDPALLLTTCMGTALVASGAAAVNQVMERDLDRLMNRTKERPLAGGRMSPREGLTIAGVLSLTGVLILLLASTTAAAVVAVATLLTYAFVYTPLKRRSSLATVVGAVPGALPPLIGWAGAGGSLSVAAPWSLFLLMFLWQLPHFLAIAWLYREDYARARMPMLPVVDVNGALTGRQAALWAATLIPVSELPFLLGMTTAVYGVAALVLGIGQFILSVRFMLARTTENARRLFFGSIIYLPLLWILMGLARK